MQVSKLFPVVGLAVMYLGLVSVRAQDTPAQAAARAALLEKMNEANGGAPVNTVTSAPPATVTPVPAESPGVTWAPPAAVTTNSTETSAQAAARAALMEKMEEMNSAAPVNTVTSAPPAAVASVPAESPGATSAPPAAVTPAPPATVTSVPAESPGVTWAPPAAVTTSSTETPEQAAARAALMEKMSELNGAESSAPSVVVKTNELQNVSSPPPVIMGANSIANGVTSPSSETMTNQNMNMPMATPPPEVTGAPVFAPVPPPSGSIEYNEAAQAALNAAKTNNVVTGAPAPFASGMGAGEQEQANVDEITAKALGVQPIQPPPPPVSAEQQEQLQELLQRYDANQITPEEYQAERAKIMAGQ